MGIVLPSRGKSKILGTALVSWRGIVSHQGNKEGGGSRVREGGKKSRSLRKAHYSMGGPRSLCFTLGRKTEASRRKEKGGIRGGRKNRGGIVILLLPAGESTFP